VNPRPLERVVCERSVFERSKAAYAASSLWHAASE